MEVILLFLLCGVLVRRAEHSFREGLPGVCGVCVCVGVYLDIGIIFSFNNMLVNRRKNSNRF